MLGAGVAVLGFVHGQGVNLTGDEPAYLTQAQAYLHLDPRVASVFRADLARHYFASFAPHANIATPGVFEHWAGPRGAVSPFEPGMALILAPFLAAGGQFGAEVGFMGVEVACLVWLHRRASNLVGLDRPGQILLGLAFAAPALWLAITQLYPDLISGLLLACGLVEVAIIERSGALSRCAVAVVGVVVAALPWLQVKNALPGGLLLLAFAVVSARTPHGGRAVSVLVVLTGVSWLLLVAYNLLYFGNPLGLPEPAPSLSGRGVEYTLGLLFDRDQGLMVQLPSAVMGLVGMWTARRRTPVAVRTSGIAAAAIVVLNGTYTSNPYGGFSFAGRFAWTAMPVVMLWSAVLIGRWQRGGRRLFVPVAVVAAAWCIQAIPILDGAHSYYTLMEPSPPWDPLLWPGWWSGLDRVLPGFDVTGLVFGAPSFALGVEIAVLVLLAWVCWSATRRGPFRPGPAVSLSAAVALGIAVVALTVPPMLPVGPLRYDAAQVGAPLVAVTAAAQGPEVALTGIQPGTYRLTSAIQLSGSDAPGTVAVSCDPQNGHPRTRARRAAKPVPPGRSVTVVTLRCPFRGVIQVQLSTPARSRLDVRFVKLRKTAT
ncbi:MAG: hypothetical protein ACYC1D_16375 [Acidimicrobiales bacterium]